MAKQHDEELQRLREDLEQTQQSSRKAHHAVSKLEEPMEAAGCSQYQIIMSYANGMQNISKYLIQIAAKASKDCICKVCQQSVPVKWYQMDVVIPFSRIMGHAPW